MPLRTHEHRRLVAARIVATHLLGERRVGEIRHRVLADDDGPSVLGHLNPRSGRVGGRLLGDDGVVGELLEIG